MNTRARGAAGAVVAALAVLGTAAAGGKQPAVVPSNAQPLGPVPTAVKGVADATGTEESAPTPACVAAEGVQWYTLKAPRRGPMVARLVARGDLDAAVVLYRVVRSQRSPVLCVPTDRHGRAQLAWYAYTDGSYLLGVVRRSGSATGPYELGVRAAERPPAPPGDPLPAAGVVSTINGVLDKADAWTVPMERGTTYRLNLTTPSTGTCIAYELYRPATVPFARRHTLLDQDCGGYAVFTPGIDGGGDYSVLVYIDESKPITHEYRLQVAAAETDDTAPGESLSNGQVVEGSLSGSNIDSVDLYRFGVPHAGELTTIELLQRARADFDLRVLDELGRRVASTRGAAGRQVLRLHIPAGAYYAALVTKGAHGGAYQLQIRVRDVTTTTVTTNGERAVEAQPGATVPLSVHVASAYHGGRVVVEIDHFDPLVGWHFDSSVTGDLDAAGDFSTLWTPSSVGVWRARARFVANPYSSFSESGYVQVHVIEPLE